MCASQLLQVDRLITELKLPPNDAYHKIRHTIEEVNALIVKYGGEDAKQVCLVMDSIDESEVSTASAPYHDCLWQLA